MNPSGAVPRRAEARDLDALAALFSELVAHHAAVDPAFAVRPDFAARLPGALARELRDPGCAVFVSEADGALAGFCTVRLARAPRELAERARAEIVDLGVRAERRREGIGRALALAAGGWAQAQGAARLEVRVAVRNPEGQAFWRALGYEGFVDVLQRRL